MLYPLILMLLAYGLFILLATTAISAAVKLYEGPPPRLWSMIAQLGQAASSWMGLIPPLVLIVVAVIWWRRTRRAIVIDSPAAVRWLSVVPVAGRVVQRARSAALAEILGLLVEHEVPLQDAIVLAAGCTGDRQLMQSADKAAEFLKQGGTFDASAVPMEGFPPLVVWLVSAGGRERAFASLARHVGQSYRRAISRDLDWLRIFLPIWLIVVVGGIVVGIYGLTFFLPYSQLLETLAGHVSSSTIAHSAMTIFHYIAVDEQGRPVSGAIEAADWQAAEQALVASGMREPRPAAAAEEASETLGATDAVELARYLTELAKSGLPLDGGLRAIAKDLPAGQLSRAIGRLAAQLEAGQPLDLAVESFGTAPPSASAAS